MRLRCATILGVVLAALALPAFAQSQPANIIRTLLAAGRLGSVVDSPLCFRLFSLRLSTGEGGSYSGPNSMVYPLSGGLAVALDGVAQTIPEGTGVFIPAGRAAVLKASGAEPARILLFTLSPVADTEVPKLGGSTEVAEVFRTPELPGLRPGPYELSLTRVVFPPGMPANPIHYRSGAALYYVLIGTGSFTADGKTEPKAAPLAHFERYGWVHQWGNPGDQPLVIIQANISQEGLPAVLPGTPPPVPR